MTDEQEIEIVPFVYAISKGMKIYKEAVTEYNNLTGKDTEAGDDSIIRVLHPILSELEKSSDLNLEDFIKKYREFEMLFSIAKKFLG